jgi:hypothetical protein
MECVACLMAEPLENWLVDDVAATNIRQPPMFGKEPAAASEPQLERTARTALTIAMEEDDDI